MQRLLSSWFGTGLVLGRLRGSDVGSGTVGAAFALPLGLLAGIGGWPWQLGIALAVILIGVWAAEPYSRSHGDPGWVVIDEAAGALVAIIGLGVPAALVAWTVFRIADIFKRAFPGVAAAERLPGAIGVMTDDLVAALYGLAAGWAVQSLLS